MTAQNRALGAVLLTVTVVAPVGSAFWLVRVWVADRPGAFGAAQVMVTAVVRTPRVLIVWRVRVCVAV